MSAEKKKELQVAALENGTAIDHIPPSQLFKVASLLGLEKMTIRSRSAIISIATRWDARV